MDSHGRRHSRYILSCLESCLELYSTVDCEFSYVVSTEWSIDHVKVDSAGRVCQAKLVFDWPVSEQATIQMRMLLLERMDVHGASHLLPWRRRCCLHIPSLQFTAGRSHTRRRHGAYWQAETGGPRRAALVRLMHELRQEEMSEARLVESNGAKSNSPSSSHFAWTRAVAMLQ